MRLFGTRTLIWIMAVGMGLLGWKADNLAVMSMALFFGYAMTMLHTIEVKLNKLLDDRGIVVRSEDLDEKWS